MPKLEGLIELGTVDSFQGKDFPLVILSSVKSNRDGRVGFLSLPNRLNVAISRAKNQVILLGDSATLTHADAGSEPFKQIWSDANDDALPGRVIASHKVIETRGVSHVH